MASALNTFKTFTHQVTGTDTTIYTAPNGYTGIILLAQVTNASTTAGQAITAKHVRDVEGTPVETLIASNLEIPPSDVSSVLTGKLVLQSGDYIKIQGGTSLDLVLSVLESLNG